MVRSFVEYSVTRNFASAPAPKVPGIERACLEAAIDGSGIFLLI